MEYGLDPSSHIVPREMSTENRKGISYLPSDG